MSETTNPASETFTLDQIIHAIECWLEYGEQTFRKVHQGIFAGDGWDARCLRFHLEQLKRPAPSPSRSLSMRCEKCGQSVDFIAQNPCGCFALAAPSTEERAEFEKWAKNVYGYGSNHLLKNDYGEYDTATVRSAWFGWQASASRRPLTAELGKPCECPPEKCEGLSIYICRMRIAEREAELSAARADRDLHYSRLASILFSGALDQTKCGEIQAWAKEYRDAQAECERLKQEVRLGIASRDTLHLQMQTAESLRSALASRHAALLSALKEADFALCWFVTYIQKARMDSNPYLGELDEGMDRSDKLRVAITKLLGETA